MAGGQDLASTLLLVPHHGSKTSSTTELLAAVAPEMALIQAGYRNRFGHPAIEVLARYQARGIKVWASPDCGAWVWTSSDASPGCQREADRRYWQARPTQGEALGPELPEAGG